MVDPVPPDDDRSPVGPGQRSVVFESDSASEVLGSRALSRRVQVACTALAVVCLAAAGVVFAVAWRWGPPPRAEVIALPPVPARQQEAFEVVKAWYDAQNRGDAAAMRAVACANPQLSVSKWFESVQVAGPGDVIVFPDAITKFREVDGGVWVQVAERIRPLNAYAEQMVQQAQERHGGFLYDQFMLLDEGGGLRVCEIHTPDGGVVWVDHGR